MEPHPHCDNTPYAFPTTPLKKALCDEVGKEARELVRLQRKHASSLRRGLESVMSVARKFTPVLRECSKFGKDVHAGDWRFSVCGKEANDDDCSVLNVVRKLTSVT